MNIDRGVGQYHDSSNANIRKVGAVTGPASYPAGGDVVTAAELGMARVTVVFFTPATNGSTFRSLVFVPGATPAAGTVKWIDGTTGLEVAAGANLSGYTARFEAIGK